MQKRLVVLGAAIALLALVAATVVPAAADDDRDRVTLRLAEKAADDEKFESEIDVGEEGFGCGVHLFGSAC